MSLPMHRNPSVSPHNFAMIPRADIPRSSFRMQTAHKTTFSSGYLIPIYLDEILPGDAFNVRTTAFCRLSTPLYPIMDNLHMDTFFFFVPCRLLWDNWERFQGEQDNPASSIAYTIPQIVSPAGGFPRLGIYDYFGLPCANNLGANTISINALPLRAYNLVYNEWFRDQNLINSVSFTKGDGPDTYSNYTLLARAKRHDYFTSCLPWTQKFTTVSLPLSGTAAVKTSSSDQFTGAQPALAWLTTAGAAAASGKQMATSSSTTGSGRRSGTIVTAGTTLEEIYPSNLYADLTTATATTINALRQSFQIQRLLERDARGGTRYTEIVRSHFGVISPDARLQRPEYLGGGSTPVGVTPIAQQSQTGLTGGTTPMGTLAAVGHAMVHGDGFSGAFTEHGYVIGLAQVRGDLSYQQGLRKLWSRSTRYDFYMPVFAHLGEQSVLNREIYCDGSANDALTFGYQERWAEYRYHPSMITGYFNSTNSTPLDAWHLAEKFTTLPALNSTFIQDPTRATLRRAVAGGSAVDDQQLIGDFFFDVTAARPMPMYSVPGLIDHF